MRVVMRVALSLLFFLLAWISRTNLSFAETDADARLNQQLLTTDANLKKRCDSVHRFPDSCDNFPLDLMGGGADDLFNQMWSLVERRSLQFVAGLGPPDPEALITALSGSNLLTGQAIRLGGDSILAEINYRDAFGEVFLAHNSGIIWRLRDLGGDDVKNFPDLILWAPWQVRLKTCKRRKDNGPCQSFAPTEIGQLPDAADGSHRFYVVAERLQETSCFSMQELTVWQWRNGKVAPLLAKTYSIDCDPTPTRFDRGILHARIKGNFKSMWNSGAGPGRELDWKIAIGPDGIRDLGETPETPATDLIDEMLFRILHKEDATALASKSAIAFLKQNLAEAGGNPPIGYDGFRSKQVGRETVLCLPLDIDKVGGIYAFALEPRGQSQFVAAVRKIDDNANDPVCGR
jgi:hypothetical protein